MKTNQNKPPMYFFPENDKVKKKTFMLIKTGKKSYAMSIMNLLSAKKAGTDFKEDIYKKG